jgi:hypothetical protein
MTWVVFAVGLLIVAGCVVLLVAPGFMRKILKGFPKTHWIVLAAAIRILIGILFIVAAPGTRASLFVQTVGVIAILAGLILPILGPARLQRLVAWFLAKPDGFFRGISVIGFAFGAAVVWAGIPV